MTARSGRRLKAADCKSFTNAEATSVPGARSERRSRGSIDLPASDSAVPPEARSARAAASKWLNTAGVDRPSSEKTATHHRDWSLGDDVPGSSCSMWSPRPRPRAIPPTGRPEHRLPAFVPNVRGRTALPGPTPAHSSPPESRLHLLIHLPYRRPQEVSCES